MANLNLDRHSNTYPFIDPGRFRGSLVGQTALVTGAGRGIGHSIALAFAQAGANVVCLARTRKEIDQTVTHIAQCGYPEAMAVSVDVACLSEISQAIASIKSKFGHVDILINNAGIDRIGSMQYETDFQAWWKVFEVNLMGPAALIHQILPDMISRKQGIIINIGSRNAIDNHPFMTAYSASKTALLRFHQCLKLELRDTNVYTFYVQPGDVTTSLMDGTYDPEELAKLPRLQAMISSMQDTIKSHNSDSSWLAANTCVMLAADVDARLLSGLYIDANQDLSQLLAEARKGKSGIIKQGKMYSLKVDVL
ncbi:Dehydrogenase/reductase SDR family member 7B [Daldinia childiae]|uniref:Dehydrogenase/reductase SDR family member 7B n=1 Tax=Daldinia childiae TaxID=326645 RepID=UPI0014486E08|nr:Dehydrogenase/reductase SDR family member 7B [Daldinia childiae]KAF3064582.1 Dehydrogenase/reductase SDR family member 7B [Daldinia childiae]